MISQTYMCHIQIFLNNIVYATLLSVLFNITCIPLYWRVLCASFINIYDTTIHILYVYRVNRSKLPVYRLSSKYTFLGVICISFMNIYDEHYFVHRSKLSVYLLGGDMCQFYEYI